MINFFTKKREFKSVKTMNIFYNVFMNKRYAIILASFFACISFFGIFKENTALNICGIIGIGVMICGYFSALLWCTLYATNKEDGFIFQIEEDASAQNDILDIGTNIIRIADCRTYHCFPVHVFEQLSYGSKKAYVDLEFDYKKARFAMIATVEVSESFDFIGAFWQWIKEQCNVDRVFRFDDYLRNLFVEKFLDVLNKGDKLCWPMLNCVGDSNNMSNVFITQVDPSKTGGISSVIFEVRSITFSK